jgi:hypothetical protein
MLKREAEARFPGATIKDAGWQTGGVVGFSLIVPTEMRAGDIKQRFFVIGQAVGPRVGTGTSLTDSKTHINAGDLREPEAAAPAPAESPDAGPPATESAVPFYMKKALGMPAWLLGVGGLVVLGGGLWLMRGRKRAAATAVTANSRRRRSRRSRRIGRNTDPYILAERTKAFGQGYADGLAGRAKLLKSVSPVFLDQYWKGHTQGSKDRRRGAATAVVANYRRPRSVTTGDVGQLTALEEEMQLADVERKRRIERELEMAMADPWTRIYKPAVRRGEKGSWRKMERNAFTRYEASEPQFKWIPLKHGIGYEYVKAGEDYAFLTALDGGLYLADVPGHGKLEIKGLNRAKKWVEAKVRQHNPPGWGME